MKRAIAYILVDGEVGTHTEVAETLDAKKRELVEKAAKLGLVLTAVYADVRREIESPKVGLRAMLAAVQKGELSAVVVENFESFADPHSTMLETFDCMKNRSLRIHVLNEERVLEREHIENVWRALNLAHQFDKKITAARIKRGLKHATVSGRRIGRRPFEDYQSNLEVYQNVQNMRQRGLSLRDICRALNSAGAQTNSHKKWYPTSIKRMLERSPV